MGSPAHRGERRTVTVATPADRYDIVIGHGLLGDAGVLRDIVAGRTAVIVTNATVAPLYAETLRAAVAAHAAACSTVVLPDGEAHKTWQTLDTVYDHLLAHRADRRSVLLALGGGVVGDMTGFAAATYMRGIDFVQVPTTLLAQVDSSVGGKTAVNHPRGKNMIGAFHQPRRVLCDLDTLATLPAREFSAGLAEVVKYGPIADAGFLRWLEANVGALLEREPAAVAHAVQRSCEIKAAVVGQDERESGLRAVLNFGHTFGHAIEAGVGYGQWLHGEAVGCGMVLAADLSARLGLVEGGFVERLARLVERAGLPTRAPAMPMARWFELMQVDKKAAGGEIRFVLIAEPGRASLGTAPAAVVEDVIRRHSAAA